MKKLSKLTLKATPLSHQEMKSIKGARATCTATCADGSTISVNCNNGICNAIDGSSASCGNNGPSASCGGSGGY